MHQNPAYCSAHVARCAEALRLYRADAFGLVAVLGLAGVTLTMLVAARAAYRRGRTLEGVAVGAVAGILAAFGPAIVHACERAA